MEIGETAWSVLLGSIMPSTVSHSPFSSPQIDQFLTLACPPGAGFPAHAVPGNTQLPILYAAIKVKAKPLTRSDVRWQKTTRSEHS